MRNERTIELEWPGFYPENCPPAGVEQVSGTVYHLVQHDPPQAEDFLNQTSESVGFPFILIRKIFLDSLSDSRTE